MKTLATAVILVALFSIAFHELSKRADQEKQVRASPETINSVSAILPATVNPVAKKLERASKGTSRIISAEIRKPGLEYFVSDSLQVYLPEEKRAVSVNGSGLGSGVVRIDDSGEKSGNFLAFSRPSGGGQEAENSPDQHGSGLDHDGFVSDPGISREVLDIDPMERNRDKDREGHVYRENGDDREHFDQSDRPAHRHRD